MPVLRFFLLFVCVIYLVCGCARVEKRTNGSYNGTSSESVQKAKETERSVRELLRRLNEHNGGLNCQQASYTPQQIYRQGSEYYDSQDYSKALECLLLSAWRGYGPSQHLLGWIYKSGKGVKQDLREARYWYTKAADQGNPTAQNSLAVMHYKGEGGKKDLQQAVLWFAKAAEQGNSTAQYNLGLSYLYGTGVKKDLVQARRWLQKAADDGNLSASKTLIELEQEELAQKKKASISSELAGKNFVKGLAYFNGKGVLQDYAKAMAYFSESAKGQHPSAQYYLGMMHEYGLGIKPDLTKACTWYARAAEKGDAMARERYKILKKDITP